MRRRFRSSRANATKSRGCHCIGFWADQLVVCGDPAVDEKYNRTKANVVDHITSTRTAPNAHVHLNISEKEWDIMAGEFKKFLINSMFLPPSKTLCSTMTVVCRLLAEVRLTAPYAIRQ
jgi:hypothetical protein